MKSVAPLPLMILSLAAWAGVGAPGGGPAPGPANARVDTLEVSGYKDVLALFEKLNYTPAAWQAGIRTVPRVYITDVTERWRDTTSSSITVLAKKQIFFRALAPLVLHSNELILGDRTRLEGIRKAGSAAPSPEDARWLAGLAAQYGVTVPPSGPASEGVLNELWIRVDIIPTSLALSQAAEESGWGTSRFAAQGNALFGQWTWGNAGMKPEQQRTQLGDYGLAAFETPLKSVMAYMLNLNSQASYTDLRNLRAAARARGQAPRGRDLAAGLSRYSERGEAYVTSLRSLMTTNKLDPTDDAYLSPGPAIYLVLPSKKD
jgi:Bax protein